MNGGCRLEPKLLEAEVNDLPDTMRPCDLQKLINSLKLKKACGIDGISKESFRHQPTGSFNPFDSSKDSKFPKKLRPISLLPSRDKVFKNVILEIVQRHIRGRNLLNAIQFGFHERHSLL
jgi:hypothetical protein